MKSKHLYKYRTIGAYTEKLLINNELFFCDPSDFNDPFECQLPVMFDMSEKERKNYIAANLNESLQDPNRKDAITSLFHSILHINPTLKDSPKKLFETAVEYIYILQSNSDSENNLKTIFFENTGIYCLTEKNDNILMWSHYADNHRGICLEFDIEKLEELGDLYEVQYVDNFYEYETVMEHIIMKSKQWEYEAEKRLVRFDLISDSNSTNSGVFKMPTNSITGIIFGCKTLSEDFKKYVELALNNNPDVKIYKAERMQGKYQLAISDYGQRVKQLLR